MNPKPSDTDELLRQATLGDNDARQRLLDRHPGRLRQMVAVRMDRRLSARVDPSDVVQEALADASQHLDDYLRDRPLAFYPWLRRFAWERLVALHRRHVLAGKRSVTREERGDVLLSREARRISSWGPAHGRGRDRFAPSSGRLAIRAIRGGRVGRLRG